MGLLCEAPGIQLRVTLWSSTSDSDRELGGSGGAAGPTNSFGYRFTCNSSSQSSQSLKRFILTRSFLFFFLMWNEYTTRNLNKKILGAQFNVDLIKYKWPKNDTHKHKHLWKISILFDKAFLRRLYLDLILFVTIKL